MACGQTSPAQHRAEMQDGALSLEELTTFLCCSLAFGARVDRKPCAQHKDGSA